MEGVGRILMFAGIILLVFGMLWYFGGKLMPFGHLPGDISIDYSNVQVFLPLTSSILLSIVLSIILWLLFSLIQ